ncbi:moricin-like [Ostrinia furnacalis]|uniref:moricin-like n=1 Tax=Ostrinia furnacalis TaxID=93504 RepID=UPI00103D3894|nr:moricin-like [Ostrinia furnacalis]
MKITALFMMVMAVLAMFIGAGQANPAPKVPVKQVAKVVGKGLKVISAAGTAHDVYRSIKDRRG